MERLIPKFSLSKDEMCDLIDLVDEKVRSFEEAECHPSLLQLHEKLINIYYDTFVEPGKVNNDSNS